jgi:hypothetical protein
MPHAPDTIPPSAAPSASMTDQVAELSALAAPNSCLDTISGRMALRVGKKNPLMPSWIAVSVYSSQIWPGWRTSRKPNTVAARLTSVAMRTYLRLYRSATTPAMGLTRKGASIRTTNKPPIAVLDPLNWAIREAEAIRLNQSPNRLIIWPNQMKRKFELLRTSSE